MKKIRFKQLYYTHAPKGVYGTSPGWQVAAISDKEFGRQNLQQIHSLFVQRDELINLEPGYTLYLLLYLLDRPALIRIVDGGLDDNRWGNYLAHMLITEEADVQYFYQADVLSLFTTWDGWKQRWSVDEEQILPPFEWEFPEFCDEDTMQLARTMLEASGAAADELMPQLIKAGTRALNPWRPEKLVIRPRLETPDQAVIALFRLLWSWLFPSQRKQATLIMGRNSADAPRITWFALAPGTSKALQPALFGRQYFGYDFASRLFTDVKLVQEDANDLMPVQILAEGAIANRYEEQMRIISCFEYHGQNPIKLDRLTKLAKSSEWGNSYFPQMFLDCMLNFSPKESPEEAACTLRSLILFPDSYYKKSKLTKLDSLDKTLEFTFDPATLDKISKMLQGILIELLLRILEWNLTAPSLDRLFTQIIDQVVQFCRRYPQTAARLSKKGIWLEVIQQSVEKVNFLALLKKMVAWDIASKNFFLREVLAKPVPREAFWLLGPTLATGTAGKPTGLLWFRSFVSMIVSRTSTTTLPALERVTTCYQQAADEEEFKLLMSYLASDLEAGQRPAYYIALYNLEQISSRDPQRLEPILNGYFRAINYMSNSLERYDPTRSLINYFIAENDEPNFDRELTNRLGATLLQSASAFPANAAKTPPSPRHNAKVVEYLYGLIKSWPQSSDNYRLLSQYMTHQEAGRKFQLELSIALIQFIALECRFDRAGLLFNAFRYCMVSTANDSFSAALERPELVRMRRQMLCGIMEYILQKPFDPAVLPEETNQLKLVISRLKLKAMAAAFSFADFRQYLKPRPSFNRMLALLSLLDIPDNPDLLRMDGSGANERERFARFFNDNQGLVLLRHYFEDSFEKYYQTSEEWKWEGLMRLAIAAEGGLRWDRYILQLQPILNHRDCSSHLSWLLEKIATFFSRNSSSLTDFARRLVDTLLSMINYAVRTALPGERLDRITELPAAAALVKIRNKLSDLHCNDVDKIETAYLEGLFPGREINEIRLMVASKILTNFKEFKETKAKSDLLERIFQHCLARLMPRDAVTGDVAHTMDMDLHHYFKHFQLAAWLRNYDKISLSGIPCCNEQLINAITRMVNDGAEFSYKQVVTKIATDKYSSVTRQDNDHALMIILDMLFSKITCMESRPLKDICLIELTLHMESPRACRAFVTNYLATGALLDGDLLKSVLGNFVTLSHQGADLLPNIIGPVVEMIEKSGENALMREPYFLFCDKLFQCLNFDLTLYSGIKKKALFDFFALHLNLASSEYDDKIRNLLKVSLIRQEFREHYQKKYKSNSFYSISPEVLYNRISNSTL